MRWRNQLLALFCLGVFIAFGVLYFQHWVVQKPFGIILIVGQGLDPTRLTLARIEAGGPETALAIDSLPYTALLKNYSLDSATPDEAAAATALATGKRVKNGAIGIDADGKALTNLLELARESGRMTGLVTNGQVTDRTPASFYAHTTAAAGRDELARTLVEKADIDVVLGGGLADFLPARKDGRRSDDLDLVLELRGRGYDIVQTLEELDAVPRWRRAKVFGLFSRGDLAFGDESEPRSEQPSLADMVGRAIELLQFNSGGYLLVVDAGLMGKAAREHNAARTISQTIELDRAVAVALRYAGGKSAIFVCGGVGIGGLTVTALPSRNGGVESLESRPDEAQLEWAGEKSDNDPTTPGANETPPAGPPIVATTPDVSSPAPVAAITQNETEDVIALASGLSADALHGISESTAVFEIIRDNL